MVFFRGSACRSHYVSICELSEIFLCSLCSSCPFLLPPGADSGKSLCTRLMGVLANLSFKLFRSVLPPPPFLLTFMFLDVVKLLTLFCFACLVLFLVYPKIQHALGPNFSPLSFFDAFFFPFPPSRRIGFADASSGDHYPPPFFPSPSLAEL